MNIVTRAVCLVLPDRDEQTRSLAGDEFLSAAVGTLTHANTLNGSPSAVWPWLAQMGAGARAGWYSHDFLDNGRCPSARRIIPELQHPAVGTVFPALPGITRGFVVLDVEPEYFLILGWPGPDGSPLVTWAFVLQQRAAHTTRLIVRARADRRYRFLGMPVSLALPLIRLVHSVMQRRQLLGIAERVGTRAAPFQGHGGGVVSWHPVVKK